MMNVYKGRAWKFGDNIDTDLIVPSVYLRAPMEVVLQHTFEAIRPDFSKQVKPGDIIVGGKSFGFGSHREKAAWVPKLLKVSVVVADSFARTFFRNCVNIGMPILPIQNVSKMVEEGDEVEVDLQKGILRNITKGTSIAAKPLPEIVLNILHAGGILQVLKQKTS